MLGCLLPAVRGAFSQLGLTTSRLAENSGARAACNNRLGMREHGSNVQASLAFNVEKVAARLGHKGLQLVTVGLSSGRRAQNINSENHCVFETEQSTGTVDQKN